MWRSVWRRREAEQERPSTSRWRRNIQVATDDGIEGKPSALHFIGQNTELKPILKNKNNPLIERIDPVSEGNNES